jgi:hypothetical protein
MRHSTVLRCCLQTDANGHNIGSWDFRDDPDDNFMLVPFADHWQQQYAALKGAIDEPRPLLLPSPNPSPALNPAPQ